MVAGLTKRFPPRHSGGAAALVLDGISFAARTGDIFAILGPSGCGKTTTLQCIAGLEMPSEGRIEIGGDAVFCSRERVMVPPNHRRLGMIFQSYAIWPHMSVFDNVAFPLAHGGDRTPTADIRRRVMAALDLVKLAHLADRPSPHLSGGQQQRVALARALVHEPRLLLLDEPLSNLDATLRDAMRVELRQLIKSLGITAIFVTHDQVEAMAMSDEVLLLRGGRVVQQGAPRDIYLRPASRFAADFMGRGNIIPGHSLGADAVATPLGTLCCVVPPDLRGGGEVAVVIRPHAIAAAADAAPGERHNIVEGYVAQVQFLGDAVEVTIEVGGQVLRAMLDPYREIVTGSMLRLSLPAARCVVVPAGDAG
jgi:iron(III) transport system ATP-binding protein